MVGLTPTGSVCKDGSVKFGLEHQPDLSGRSSEALVLCRRTFARRDEVGENCSGRSNGFKLKLNKFC